MGSVPTARGWNENELRDLIPPGTRLVPAAVLVGLVPRASGTQVLLTLRTGELRRHAGQVSFPGGRIDSGDADPAAAAIREAGEEVGLMPAQIAPLGWLDPLLTATGFRVLPLVARLAPEYAPVPNPREVADVFEVPLDFLLAPENLRTVRFDYRGHERHVLEYVERDVPGPRIWGATASILSNLRARLGSSG